MMDDLISILSEIRSNYNCFDENEEPYYRALSEAIRLMSAHPEKRTKERTKTHACDCISRKAAIDAFLTELTKRERKNLLHTWSTVEVKYFVVEMLEQLPSAQPDTDEWCTDCKEYDQERHCCPRWTRVIRETLKDARPEITRCKDCKYWGERGLCDKWDYYISNGDFYCGCAERRQ